MKKYTGMTEHVSQKFKLQTSHVFDFQISVKHGSR